MTEKTWTHWMRRDDEVRKVRLDRERGLAYAQLALGVPNRYTIALGMESDLEKNGWEFEERVLTIGEQVMALSVGTRFILKIVGGTEYLCRRKPDDTYEVLHNGWSYRVSRLLETSYRGVEVLPDVHVHEFIGRPRSCYCGAVEA